MDTCSLCSQLLGPRDVEGTRGRVEGGLGNLQSGVAGRSLGGGAEVLAWPQPSVPLHTRLLSADDPSLLRKPPPIFIFLKFTGCGASAQSHWLVFWDFFLVFRFFFLNKVFLGAITQKGPGGCVCV